jgi:hypothetical protein
VALVCKDYVTRATRVLVYDLKRIEITSIIPLPFLTGKVELIERVPYLNAFFFKWEKGIIAVDLERFAHTKILDRLGFGNYKMGHISSYYRANEGRKVFIALNYNL